MVVTWSTVDWPEGGDVTPFVEWGTRLPWQGRTNGSTTRFVDTGDLHLAQFIHRVTLTDLQPHTSYSELLYAQFIAKCVK